jgi:hypothetical protein
MKGMHASFQHILKGLRWLEKMPENPHDIFVVPDDMITISSCFFSSQQKGQENCWKTERHFMVVFAGVQSVEINRKQYKVTVQGFVEPHKVVKRVQATGKKAEIWPYIPYNLVAHPYAAQTYDKKAPPGYVRKVDAVMPVASYGTGAGAAQEERLTTMFSDDNPNACSIM